MERVPQTPFSEKMDETNGNLRNIWCPKYEACLTKAALANKNMICSTCPLRDKSIDVFVLTSLEIKGCMDLVDAIFRLDFDGFAL